MRRSIRDHAASVDRLLTNGDASSFPDDVVHLVEQLRAETEQFGTPTELVARLAAEARGIDGAPSGPRTRTTRPLPTRWRRRIMLSTFLSSLAGKLAIGSVALATTTGGLAATGNLPDPVQDWTADRLGAIGIEIPSSEVEIETEVDAEIDNETASDVLDVIDSTDPADRDEEFGGEVADTASDGASTEGLDRADDGAANAGDYDDIAEQKTEDVPTGVDDIELPEEADSGDDELPEEAESGADNAEQGDAFRP